MQTLDQEKLETDRFPIGDLREYMMTKWGLDYRGFSMIRNDEKIKQIALVFKDECYFTEGEFANVESRRPQL